nr:non-ribosomal peptide synthetase [uncultured Chitinophaga sp.]
MKLEKSNVQDILELNMFQKGILFHYQKDYNENLYNVQVSFLIEGMLNPDILNKAFRVVQSGNEVLRSVFRWKQLSKPLQVILRDAPLEILYSDHAGEDAATAGALAEGYLEKDRCERFDLTLPPIRLRLIKTASTAFVFAVTHQHILYDGWSTGILLKELFNTYHELAMSGTSVARSKPSYQAVEQTIRQQTEPEKTAAFWKGYLQGYTPKKLVPVAAEKTAEGREVYRYTASGPMALLNAFVAEYKVTRAAVIYAACALLLQKYNNVGDVVLGATVSNRDTSIKGAENVMGNFINTIPFRLNSTDDLSLLQMVKNVNLDLIRITEFAGASYFEIRQWVDLKAADSLFDAVVVIENYPLDESLINGYNDFRVRLHTVYENTGIPLGIYVFFREQLEIEFVYSPDNISNAIVEAFAAHLLSVVRSIIETPQLLLSALNLFSDNYRQSVYDRLHDGAAAAKVLVPASWHQERLWFIDQFERDYLYKGNPVYHNIPLQLSISGEPDVALLERAIAGELEQHSILRTRVCTLDDQPYQVVSDDMDFTLERISIDEDALEGACMATVRRAFEPEGFLCRGVLYHYGVARYRLLLVLHHMIVDRYSVVRLAEHILQRYASLQRGEACYRATGLSYADFAVWQKEVLQQLDPYYLGYWKRQLAGPLQPLELPLDRPRAAIHTYTGSRTAVCLPADLTALADAYAASRGITPELLLLSGFIILLHKYSGHEEIMIGTSTDNRGDARLRDLIGPVSNLVALRSFTDPEKSYDEYLVQLQEVYTSAMAYGDMPFDKLVKELSPEKDMSRTALFDVLYQYSDVKADVPDMEGLEVSIEALNEGYGKYDLNLLLWRDGAEIKGSLVFNLDYMDASRASMMMLHYSELLRRLLTAGAVALSEISVLPLAEQQLQLQSLDHTGVAYPEAATVLSMFDARVIQAPAATAVQMGDETISYAVLDRRSSAVAALLRHHGAGRNKPVALLMDRSIDMIVGMLGILKSGSGYVPVDVDYPADRREYIISDSGSVLVLTDRTAAECGNYGVPVLHITEAENELYHEPYADDAPAVTPSDLCYIIYTSGTTGRPKGVMIEHRHVVRLFFNDSFRFRFSDQDVWTMFHSHCFDFSVWEIYGALLFGGRLIVIPKLVAMDTRAYLDILIREKVTVLNQTPGSFYQLAEEEAGYASAALKLRYVIFGGEALTPAKLDRWHRRYPSAVLVNMFGITETTVHVTYKEIGETEIQHNISNIGQPIPTLSVYIWDSHQRAVPRGVTGELYIGGAGVARGYVNNARLTAEKFIAHPYRPGERVYRSGDLGRQLASGDIEYLGRADSQVKIRGFRIELGEIEAALSAYRGIAGCAVVVKEKKGEKLLSAYYVCDTETDETGIKQYLLQRLPDYMVPAYFIRLKKLPLTVNGKLDRNVLPDPDLQSTENYIAPSGAVALRLAAIWSEILQADISQISADSSFFDIGGHSLKASILVNRINKEFEVGIQLKDIFTWQDIAGQAGLIAGMTQQRFVTIGRAAEKEYYPLSSSQKRLYFLYQLDKSSLAYNMSQVFNADGVPDRERLKQSFRTLIDRHESLRTGFEMIDDVPVQRVYDNVSFEIEELEVGDADLLDITAKFIRPFNLSHPPLIRVGLLHYPGDQSILIIDIHHIVSDGLSNSILIKDLVDIYEGRDLQVMPLQYKDYAVWEQGEVYRHDIAVHRSFWMDEFSAGQPLLDLSTDYPRPIIKNDEGDVLSFYLDEQEAAGLKAIAAQEECTLFMVVLSLYAMLLNKLTGQEDIVTGVAVAGREHADLEQVAGMFVNTLPVRLQPAGGHAFRAFLQTVKKKVLQCLGHASFPYDELVEALKIQRDAGRNPLFDVAFAYENFDDITFSLSGLIFTPVAHQVHKSKFDLTLSVVEQHHVPEIKFDYSTALYKRETIERIAGYFRRLIAAVIAEPDNTIAEMSLLSEGEKYQLVRKFNNTVRTYPVHETIPGLFHQQVAKTPDATALISEGTKITYCQLSEAVDRLAARLQKKGLKRGGIVAVLLRRSPELVISILAILKAGGTYLPVDTGLPEKRISYMLQDSQCEILLTAADQADIITRLQATEKTVVYVKDPVSDNDASPFEAPLVASSDLAYIIYTSGTTGRPKGVMVAHRSLINYVCWAADNYLTGVPAVFPLYTSISFDLTITSVFVPLLTGNSIVIYDGTSKDLLIERVVADNEATIIKLTPSHLKVLADSQWKHTIAGSRINTLIVGGENLETSLAAAIDTKFRGDIRIFNEYGPTEATIGCMIHLFNTKDATFSVPLGIPAANTQIYLLDRYQKPVLPCVDGEVYISGDCLAEGYLFREDLTNSKFIPNPFIEGKSMYKTGDLARYLPDGTIVFSGRTDEQVKIRGHRVEPAEIAQMLTGHAAVKDAVVMAIGNSEDRSLVAWYVQKTAVDASELKDYLAAMLPDYMVPTWLMVVEAIPLTGNGKVNKDALPKPGAHAVKGYKAPVGSIEIKLTEIWSEILKLDKNLIGVNSNFFELGGHSLRAARLVNCIFREFNVDIPLREIFRHQQISGISRLVQNARKTVQQPITKSEVKIEYPLSSAQKRLFFLYELDSSSHAYNITQAYRVSGTLDRERLNDSFSRLIDRHESLRTAFIHTEEGPVQRIADSVHFETAIIAADDADILTTIENFIRPFDLGKPPLIRAGLLQLPGEECLLVIDVHHIISDGLSNSILIKDFISIYEGNELDPLPLQYRDYSEWERGKEHRQAIAASKAFWMDEFEGHRPGAGLPTDYPRPAVRKDVGDSLSFCLDETETAGLKAIAEQEGCTMFMVVLSLYAILISKLSGKEDMVIGVHFSGREHADLEGVAGMFVNLLPVKLQVPDNATFSTLLAAIKEKTLRAFDHASYPYDELVETLKVQRDTSRNPLFDIVFAYDNFDDNTLSLKGIDFTPVEHRQRTSKFDITFSALMQGSVIKLHAEYVTALYTSDTIQRWLTAIKHIATGIISNVNRPVGDISLITAAARKEVFDKLRENAAGPLPGFKMASWHQERLWFIDQFERDYLYKGNPVYHNIPLQLSISGEPDVALLERAIAGELEQHSILRTRVCTLDDQPYQVVSDDMDFTLERISIDEDALEGACMATVRRAFEPEGFLCRGVLYHYGVARYRLLLVLHHMIVDRYSVVRLAEHILQRYASLQRGEACYRATGLSYADFAVWQKEVLQQLDPYYLGYWKRQLAGPLQPLELPLDRPRAAIHTYTGSRTAVCLPADLTALADAYAASRGITPELLLLSGFIILLHKYSGHEEIMIGTSTDNRGDARLRDLIGPVSNLVALRSFTDPEKSYDEYLVQLQEVYTSAMAYGDMPFDKLVKELSPEKDMSRTALFDVLYQYSDVKADVPDMEGLEVSIEALNEGYGKYDLNLLLWRDGAEIKGSLVFNLDYMDASRASMMMLHYSELLRRLLTAGAVALSEISVLPLAEQQLQLQSLDHTGVAYPEAATVLSMFDARVIQAPAATAVQMGDETISYAVLDRRSSAVAALLRHHGAGRNKPVALLMDRSIDMIVGMLGILKSGSGYVPVDVDYPADRREYIISDSGSVLVLTDRTAAECGNYGVPVLHITEAENELYHEPYADDAPAVTPSDLCYIIYTSGTTGRPKGVMIEHRHVVRLFFNDSFRFRFSDQDVWTMFHSHCFDFSVWEIYGALLFGGRLIVIPKLVAMDTRAYLDILIREKVTVLNQTPGSFYQLAEEEAGYASAALKLRYVIFGGEALTPAKLDRWHRRYPSAVLVNMFGITETTVHVTYKEIGETEIQHNISNIGQPIPTLSVYIWDSHQRAVPRGVTGELYIGGAGVARGYVNNARLTAEKFIAHPYRPGERVYRSGDLGRQLASGDIEYLGRADSQVKIRGFRIELGEIEAALSAYRGIAGCAVVVKEKKGEKLLSAYYVCDTETDETGIKQYLLQRLPDYMVPAYFIRLKKLPLTVNGKLDRNVLPDPDLQSTENYIAPSGAVALRLAAIWSEILQADISQISADSSFFDIGGHSLKASILVNRINKEFEVGIQLKDIFTWQDIAGQAGLIAGMTQQRFVTIGRAAEKEYYPLSSSQKRLYFLYQLDRSSLAYNMFRAFRMEGEINPEKIACAFKTLIERHESLRTSFDLVDDEPVQRITGKIDWSIEIFHAQEADVLTVVRRFVRPFDLGKPHLLRVGIIWTAAQSAVLLIDTHHIISDGISERLLIQDFVAIYQQKVLPGLRLHYKDYAEWELQRNPDEDAAQCRFWTDTFREVTAPIELPVDFSRPPIKSHEGGVVKFTIGREERAALKQIATSEGCTMFMLLLAIYHILLSRLSCQEEVVTGVPVAARAHADLEKVMGMFVNTLAIKNVVMGDLTVREFLAAVKQRVLSCFENQAYPYEKLIEELKITRNTSRNPLFDVMFSFENFDSTVLRIPGAEITPFDAEYAAAQFDLVLWATEREDDILMRFDYAAKLFKKDTVVRFAGYFNNVVKSVIADVSAKIADIRLIGDTEERRLLEDFNHTGMPYPVNKTVAMMVAEQAAVRPEDIALVFEGTSLTYRELNERANQMGNYLRRKGVAEETLVAVCMDRSAGMVIALLGVMKAGGIYIPIEPEHPEERIRYMLRDTAADIVIASSASLAKLSGDSALTVICPDTDWQDIAGEPQTAPATATMPDHVAYIIYTSGSTGNPKGVMIEHHSLVNFLVSMKMNLAFQPGDSLLSLTSFGFDIFYLELYLPLVCGGKVFLTSRETVKDTVQLLAAIASFKPGFIQATPSVWQLLLAGGWKNAGHATLLAGGEAVSERLKDALTVLGTTWNMYGPTETTIWSSMKLLDGGQQVSIGKPIGNTTVYIVGSDGRLSPLGVPGELWIGGAGVARGYMNQPELTAEKFVPHISGGEARLYKTGDLVRWLPDGDIICMGRIDDQVKIRGHRIEPGEIAGVLQQGGLVKEAVVAVKGIAADAMLVCYYVADKQVQDKELRSWLSARLPDYMIPACFMQLEAIPLNANGKTDRKALPAPEIKRDDTYVAPATMLEKKLAEIWAEVLQLDAGVISTGSNFFDLGGHSVKAGVLLGRISREFNIEIPLRQIFVANTIEKLCEYIEDERWISTARQNDTHSIDEIFI